MLVEFESFGNREVGFFKTEEVSYGRVFINPVYVKYVCGSGPNRTWIHTIDGGHFVVSGKVAEVVQRLNSVTTVDGETGAVVAEILAQRRRNSD